MDTLRRINPAWIALWILTFGLTLIMFGARPELQPRPASPEASGPTIALVGHGVTWSAAVFLAYRAWRYGRLAPQAPTPTATTTATVAGARATAADPKERRAA